MAELISVSKEMEIDNYSYAVVCEDNSGHIWAATESSGIIKLVGDDIEIMAHDMDNPKSISRGYIHSLAMDNKSRMWVGVRGRLNIYEAKSDSFAKIRFDLEDISPYCSRVYCFAQTNDNHYWVGSGCGLLLVDEQLNLIEQYTITPLFDEKGYDENVLYLILQDRYDSNKLWIGTRSGLKSFNKSDATFTTHPNPDKWHDMYPHAQQYAIMDIVQTSPEVLWMSALWSGGILKYNHIKNQWNQYLFPNSSSAIPRSGNQMHTLKLANDSMFVYGNNLGYGYFHTNTGTYEPLNPFEFGDDRRFFRQYIDRFGFVWIAGSEGLFKSAKKLPHFNAAQVSPPQIQSIIANGFNIDNYINHVHIDIDSNDLEIKIYSPNYPYSYSNNIRWKVNDDAEIWNTYDVKKTIQFHNLQVGIYTLLFEIRKSPTSDEWIEGIPLIIHITQPFYRTTWFIISMLASAFALVFWLFHLRVQTIKKREQIKSAYERQLAEVKMSALNAQMNPHFLFNTMNSINHFILKNEPDKASHYLTRFSRLIRQILYNSRQSLVTLEDELNAMALYVEMEQLRLDGGFEFQTDIESAIDLEKTCIPPMLIQPYLENAIWHGLLHKDNNRKLNLTIEKDGLNLSISIKDNGIGRQAAALYHTEYNKARKSVGMSITQDRIELANKLYKTKADVEIIDHLGHDGSNGTEIIITIPLLDDAANTV